MPEIIPFRGILYNRNKIKTLAEAVAPPYDIISSRQQGEYYRKNKYNVIRLILGREHIRDNERNNKYTRAAKILDNWLRQGVLKKDRNPSIYIYRQEYYEQKEKRTRLGFLALMRIENFNKRSVLPHEDTFVKPKQDRLNLLRQVKANLSPIFSLFSDRNDTVSGLIEEHCCHSRPCVNFEQDGVRHKLWRLSRKRTVEKIAAEMRSKQIVIADGHHRYETAMEFCEEMREERAADAGRYNYVMVYFTALENSGLTILPTHRLIEALPPGIDSGKLKGKLGRYFKLLKFDNCEDMLLNMKKEGAKSRLFGMYEGKNFYILKLKNDKVLDSVIGKDKPRPWRKLDVAVLHGLVLERILCLKDRQGAIGYTRDASYARAAVDSGKYKIAFFLNPTKLSQVRAIAGSGVRMPQKSTYFYPKVLSGLVINKFK